MLSEPAATLIVHVEVEQEAAGRWIADVIDIPGVMAYGATEEDAIAKAKVLALEVVTDRLAHGEDPLTGCLLGKSCPPSAASFGGLEFRHALAS